ncbi:MAG: LacI family transcriptional regulator [Candidatus Parvarchaeota archaeon]|nr:LacI family transcriptional regulator [Candidatus Jingweiarchaeum tengchongense]MCW1305940.1 LacI family transcriptional regulator [Candidatus Jingweiarchaeum tengchongense]
MDYLKLKDIAEKLHISTSSVSKALNGRFDVSNKTRDEVLKIANELGYIPNKSAVSLRKQKTYIMGVIVEDNSNPFWSEVLRWIEKELRGKGYHILFVNTNRDYKNELDAIDIFLQRRLDGLLIVPTESDYEDLIELSNKGIKFVIMGRDIKNDKLNVSMVYTDDIYGGYIATKHLIEKGCKRIAFIGAQTYNSSSKLRFEGYKKALDESGLALDNSLIKFNNNLQGSFLLEIEESYNCVFSLVKDGVHFDGIFSYNDVMAFGVLKALNELRISIPDNVKVIGYDDILYSSIIFPKLTTVRTDKKLLGETAVSLLFDPDIKRVSLKGNLVIRETC